MNTETHYPDIPTGLELIQKGKKYIMRVTDQNNAIEDFDMTEDVEKHGINKVKQAMNCVAPKLGKPVPRPHVN